MGLEELVHDAKAFLEMHLLFELSLGIYNGLFIMGYLSWAIYHGLFIMGYLSWAIYHGLFIMGYYNGNIMGI